MPKPNWSIVNLERHLSDGAVYTAHWTAVLEEIFLYLSTP
jgi:hypothetical protein